MTHHGGLSTDELWRRVGLEELREAVKRVGGTMQQFERTLEALPTCNACARLVLLKDLAQASRQLGRETVGLSVLLDSLKQAMAIVEQEQQSLSEAPLQPCRCAGEPCRCHS